MSSGVDLSQYHGACRSRDQKLRKLEIRRKWNPHPAIGGLLATSPSLYFVINPLEITCAATQLGEYIGFYLTFRPPCLCGRFVVSTTGALSARARVN